MDLSRYGTGVLASAIAEFVSSFYFVFCSCVAMTLWSAQNESSLLYISVLSGLSIAVVSYCSCEITKASANPVVTIALYLSQRLDRLRFFLFLPAQILGGLWLFTIGNLSVAHCWSRFRPQNQMNSSTADQPEEFSHILYHVWWQEICENFNSHNVGKAWLI